MVNFRTLKEEIEVLELGLPPQDRDGFIGGRLDPQEASLILLPVPWEATVSFGEGTANAPDAIRVSSHQLDVENFHYIKPYTAGICMLETDKRLLKLSNKARKKALKVIEALENGETNKKALILLRIRAFSNFALLRSGAYGTRTRDPMRDRHVF